MSLARACCCNQSPCCDPCPVWSAIVRPCTDDPMGFMPCVDLPCDSTLCPAGDIPRYLWQLKEISGGAVRGSGIVSATGQPCGMAQQYCSPYVGGGGTGNCSYRQTTNPCSGGYYGRGYMEVHCMELRNHQLVYASTTGGIVYQMWQAQYCIPDTSGRQCQNCGNRACSGPVYFNWNEFVRTSDNRRGHDISCLGAPEVWIDTRGVNVSVRYGSQCSSNPSYCLPCQASALTSNPANPFKRLDELTGEL